MAGGGRRLGRQAGQAMLEYALILATVGGAFAVGARLGASSVFVDRLSDANNQWNILLTGVDPQSVHNEARTFNNQIVYR